MSLMCKVICMVHIIHFSFLSINIGVPQLNSLANIGGNSKIHTIN